MAIWFPGRSYSLRMLSSFILLRIASSRCVFVVGVYVCFWSVFVFVVGVCMCVFGRCVCLWSVCVCVFLVGVCVCGRCVYVCFWSVCVCGRCVYVFLVGVCVCGRCVCLWSVSVCVFLVGVCYLLFLYRYMRPEGPWQRLAAALSDSSLLFKLYPFPGPDWNFQS